VISVSLIQIRKILERGGDKLPAGEALPYTATVKIFPCCFVTNKVFQMKPYLNRPCLQITLTSKIRIYIYRIISNRIIVKYSFRMEPRKFYVFMHQRFSTLKLLSTE
jgi:hypothetical protein